MFLYHDYWNPYLDGIEYDEYGKEYRVAYYFGLVEYLDLSNKIGIFVTQNYGHYFKNRNNIYRYSLHRNNYNKTVDFKIGVSYKLKN